MNLSNYATQNFDTIIKNSENGVRKFSSKVTYTNFSINANTGKTGSSPFNDNVYYSDENGEKENDQAVNYYSPVNVNEYITKRFEAESTTSSATNGSYSGYVNVYTPITVESDIFVNGIKTNTIKQFQEFDIHINPKIGDAKYNMQSDTLKKYSYGYYVKFDFDVVGVKINGKLYNGGSVVKAGEWIKQIIPHDIDGNATLTAKTYYTESGNNTFISEKNNGYTIRAVAMNTPNSIRLNSLGFNLVSDTCTDTSTSEQCKFIKSIYNQCSDTGYFKETDNNVTVEQLLFDFRITDVKDINYKSVFRRTSGNATNHTGTVYYSGYKETVFNGEKDTIYKLRKTTQIGSNVKKVLPMGPYKNTNTSYVKAPKLGYRFSFDLKLAGTYTNNKQIKITPTFYYISKNGDYNSILDEYTKGKKGIYLFYENSDGKYVRVGSSSDKYIMSYIPNDLYRLKATNIGTSHLKTSSVTNTLKTVTLTAYTNTTVDTSGGMITWYGEYKLPNSTIAVEVDENGKYNINKPLTNGYIGVRFNIEETTSKANYNEQWEKEGYLNYDDKLTTYKTLTLRLEKGTLKLNTKDQYNKIKGTVMLYDIDQRADTDFD